MNATTLEIPSGQHTTLTTPRQIRDYINERGEGRTFHIESIAVRQDQKKILVDLSIAATGAEQLDPFVVTLGLGQLAARQLLVALSTALAKPEHGEAVDQ